MLPGQQLSFYFLFQFGKHGEQQGSPEGLDPIPWSPSLLLPGLVPVSRQQRCPGAEGSCTMGLMLGWGSSAPSPAPFPCKACRSAALFICLLKLPLQLHGARFVSLPFFFHLFCH